MNVVVGLRLASLNKAKCHRTIEPVEKGACQEGRLSIGISNWSVLPPTLLTGGP